MTKQTQLSCKTIVAESADRSQKALHLEITYDCPICGSGVMGIPGHHVSGLLKLLADAVEAHPDLCGSSSGIHLLQSTTFGGEVPPDPSRN